MITIREMRREDLDALHRLSPAAVKNPVEFHVYPTLVAVTDEGEIAGYTQFSLGPDRILHSQAIRVDTRFKGQGVGRALANERIRLGQLAGATAHFAAVAPDGEEAMKKILVAQGMHLCRKSPNAWVYVQHFGDDA
jgi:ribosomal protein S18 acetylase RimI-like enzyme